MTEHKCVPIKKIVDVVIIVMRWKHDVIYNVSRSPVFNMIPIIKFRRTLFPLQTLSFPGPVFFVNPVIQLD